MKTEPKKLNESVSLEIQDGVATVWLDTPERSVNVLNESMLDGLTLALDWLERELHASEVSTDIECVAFRSQKDDAFIVGADVHAIAGLKCSTEAEQVLRFGQTLFQRIEQLAVPTIAAIHGPCMGGGLELALACDYRVALNHPKTLLALPEIKLGLIPGWGGTQRLPKIVGLRESLKMILTGSSRNPERASKCGLIHRSIPDEYWELFFEPKRLKRFCHDQRIIEHHAKSRLSIVQQLRHWALEGNGLAKRVMLSLAKRKSAAQSKHYPAINEAIAVIRAGVASGGQAFEVEREAFSRLLFTNTAQSLIGLFLNRDRAKKNLNLVKQFR